MKIKLSTVSYRRVLPVVQLLVCAVILLPIRYRGIQNQPLKDEFEFSVTNPESGHSPNDLEYESHELPEYPENFWIAKLGDARLAAPAFLNLPAGIVSLPYVLLNPARTEWVPKGMDFRLWRALSWPIVGLVFWWVAGLGIEALISAHRGETIPRIGWIATSIGLLTSSCGVMCLIGSLFAAEESSVPAALLGGTGAMWILLGGSTVAAHVIQRKMRRRIRAANATEGLSI